ncbi:sigma factor [Iamia sp.]|uniref:sigma factor n=1 Tax=Iamia sp. TaxID=2722710 RepID=UPI002D04AF10|nr:sigma factor [Iamia sp.]HXH58453.1 sigma factor [Iamia sp.]
MGVPEDRWEDAFQDGTFGLMRAAQMFDPSKGFKFSTYAQNWIRQALDRRHAEFEGRSYRAARA